MYQKIMRHLMKGFQPKRRGRSAQTGVSNGMSGKEFDFRQKIPLA
jgi:hypothetical protein